MKDNNGQGPSTRAIHAGPGADPLHGAVSVPIYQSSTFAFRNTDEGAARFAGASDGYIYTRLGNPTVAALEEAVCELEEGAAALATATGMAAVSTVFLALLKSGDHVVGTDAVYGPSRLLLEKQLAKFGIRSSWVPTEDLAEVRRAMRPETRMLYIETPANPTIKLTDLKACGVLAREAKCLFVVDNTFSSPLLQRPFRFGADVVIHSLTKFLSGHTDVVGGMILVGRAELRAEISAMLRSLGGTMDPHQAWLVLRGIKTLALRVEKAQRNARELAAWLAKHPAVAWVSYPGLSSHPQHDLALVQMEGPGAMISFGVKGGLPAAKALNDAVRLATLAVSLGGVETLIEHPASMTHASVPRREREAAGITDDLVRLAVGCEDVEDLKADLEQALAHASALATADAATPVGAAAD